MAKCRITQLTPPDSLRLWFSVAKNTGEIIIGLLLQMSHVVRTVCLSVLQNRELCKNGWTDRNTVWRQTLEEPWPEETYSRWKFGCPTERGSLGV